MLHKFAMAGLFSSDSQAEEVDHSPMKIPNEQPSFVSQQPTDAAATERMGKSSSRLLGRQKKRLNPNHPLAGLQRQKPRLCNPLLSVAQRSNDNSTSADMLPTSDVRVDTESAVMSDENETSADATRQHALQSSGDFQHSDKN